MIQPIEYQSAYYFYNKQGRPVFHQCDTVTVTFDYNGHKLEHRCGQDAMYIIWYIGPMTGRKISKHLCNLCFSHWIERHGAENFKEI